MRKKPTDPTMVGNLKENVRKTKIERPYKPKSIFNMIPLILKFCSRVILRDVFRFLLKKLVLSSFSLSLL